MAIAGIRRVAAQLSAAAPDDRSRDILERLARGETIEEIGKGYGITRERVRQIAEREALHAADALGIDIPEGAEPLPFKFAKREEPPPPPPPRCIDCGEVTIPHARRRGRCLRCDQRWRYRENIGGRRDMHRETLKRHNSALKAAGIADEQVHGLAMEFGKKPMPPRLRKGIVGKWYPIFERADGLEAGDWFSVDLPTAALAQLARAAVTSRCRTRWPASLPDGERRDYVFQTEEATLFVKRVR